MKDDRVYLQHILRCISRIEEYTRGGRDTFFSSTLVQDAVIRNLQTLAESTQRVNLPVWRVPGLAAGARDAPPLPATRPPR